MTVLPGGWLSRMMKGLSRSAAGRKGGKDENHVTAILVTSGSMLHSLLSHQHLSSSLFCLFFRSPCIHCPSSIYQLTPHSFKQQDSLQALISFPLTSTFSRLSSPMAPTVYGSSLFNTATATTVVVNGGSGSGDDSDIPASAGAGAGSRVRIAGSGRRPATHGSRTLILDLTETVEEDTHHGILDLAGEPQDGAEGRRVQWDDDVIDNEHMNKKKSKSKPRKRPCS